MWTGVVLLWDIPIRADGIHSLQKTFIECVDVPDGINCLRGHLDGGASMIADATPNHYLGTSLGCLTPLLHFVAEEQEQALFHEDHLRPVCISVLQAPVTRPGPSCSCR